MDALLFWIVNDLPPRFMAAGLFEAARYAIGTLGVFFLVWILLEPWLRSRKIRKPTPRSKQIRMELINSFKTVCVFVSLDILLFEFGSADVLKKYDDVSDYGWVWFFLSVPVAIVLHDAYFYWAHRAMHHPKLYKFFHLTHHRSHNPTPFTAYSFAPSEAAVQYAFVPLMLLFVPLHGTALFTVLGIMIFKNASGHCGYELFPRGTTRNPILKHSTTVTHHDMHHEKANGNYGFYFTWWDRWMGTEHADYEARFNAVTEKGRQMAVAPA